MTAVFKALENIKLSLQIADYKGNIADRALQLLKDVGLTEFHGKKRSTHLSGGEQQRVAIARALAPNPPVILAGEPTGNLDSENGKNIVNILKKLAHEENRCVIVITHAAEVAAEADILLNMRDGELRKDS